MPEFDNDDALAEFWAAHSPQQFGMNTRSMRPSRELIRQPRKLTVTMLLDPWLKEALMEQAARRGVGYQTLARMWLAERVRQESGSTPQG